MRLIHRIIILTALALTSCTTCPAQEQEPGVQMKAGTAGNLPVIERSGLLADSGVSANDVVTEDGSNFADYPAEVIVYTNGVEVVCTYQSMLSDRPLYRYTSGFRAVTVKYNYSTPPAESFWEIESDIDGDDIWKVNDSDSFLPPKKDWVKAEGDWTSASLAYTLPAEDFRDAINAAATDGSNIATNFAENAGLVEQGGTATNMTVSGTFSGDGSGLTGIQVTTNTALITQTVTDATNEIPSGAAVFGEFATVSDAVADNAAALSAILDTLSGSLWYGVEWDLANSSPDATRIGNLDLHASLPVQEEMYAVLLNDDGTENYKLDPTDWTKKANGTASNLDGSDGQVMIKIPEYYFAAESSGTVRRWKISLTALDGFERVPTQYISAYEAALDRTNNLLASVVNTIEQYRGGNNTAAWDAQSNTLLGKPATSISRTNFRTYARARGEGWELYNYWAHRSLMVMFVTEYATRNSQAAVNAALDASGYKQGGLGIGCTDLNSDLWNAFSSHNPVLACGVSDALASGSGEVLYTMPTEYATNVVTQANRYRGVENPFGHIWKNADGVNIRIYADSEATPISEAFVGADPADWSDSTYTGYTNIGEIPRASGYISEVLAGHILPLSSVGGGSTTYWCDNFYTSLPSSGVSLRTVRFGGSASSGSAAGLGYSNSNNSPAASFANIGSRLCYIPAE